VPQSLAGLGAGVLAVLNHRDAVQEQIRNADRIMVRVSGWRVGGRAGPKGVASAGQLGKGAGLLAMSDSRGKPRVLGQNEADSS
jgi:hypothetical protein